MKAKAYDPKPTRRRSFDRLLTLATVPLLLLAQACGRVKPGGWDSETADPRPPRPEKKDHYDPDSPEARGLTGRVLPPPPDASIASGRASGDHLDTPQDIGALAVHKVMLRQEELERRQDEQGAELKQFRADFGQFAEKTDKRLEQLNRQLTELVVEKIRPRHTPEAVAPGAQFIRPPDDNGAVKNGKTDIRQTTPPDPPETKKYEIVELPAPVEATAEKKIYRRRLPYRYTPEGRAMLQEAENAYRTVIRNFPQTEEADQARWKLAQLILKRDGDVNEALDWYLAVLREWREEDDGRPEDRRKANGLFILEAARLLTEVERYGEARMYLNMILTNKRYAEGGFEAEARYEIARAYSLEPDNAAAAYDEWRALMMEHPDAHIGWKARRELAELCLREKRWSKAREILLGPTLDRRPLPKLEGDDLDYASLRAAFAYLREAEEEGAGGDAQRRQARVDEAQILLKDIRTRRGRGEAGEPGTANDDISIESDLLAAKAYELSDNPYYAARILAQTADDHPNAKNYYEMRRRAAENYVAAGGHLAQAAAQYKALLVRVRREYPAVRAEIEPQALLALASILRHQNRQETLLEAQKHLDELERAYPHSSQAREAPLERAEIYVAHALRAAPTGSARPRLMRNAFDLLDDFAVKNAGSPLEVKAKLRKAELEETDGQPHLSLLTYLSIDAGALERGDPRGADRLRFDQAVRRMEQAAERPEALRLLRRMAGDPLVDSLLRAQAAFRVAICLRAMGESEEARKAFEEFAKIYDGDTSDVKGETAQAAVKKLAQEAAWYAATLKKLIEQREKVAAARDRLRGEDSPK